MEKNYTDCLPSLQKRQMTKRKAGYWALAFVVLFLLSQDYLFVQWPKGTSWLGFPKWLTWFMLLHAGFIIVFYFFSKKYWK